jgi:hypothetical protein
MGRCRADSKPGEFTISGQMADQASRVPAGDYGRIQRSTGATGGLHDGQPVWEDRNHQQHLRLLYRTRSQPDAGLAADSGDGTGMEPRQTGTTHPEHSGNQGSDWESQSQGWRQHDNPKNIWERGTVEHCRIEQPSGAGEQTNPDCVNGRDRQNADVIRSRRGPNFAGDSEDRKLFQSENLSRFDSHGQRRISYRGSI